jgi:magnesium transporter
MPDSVSGAVCLVQRHGQAVEELPPARFAEIDRLLADSSTMVWLAVGDPGPRELALLRDEFGVHELAMEDIQKRGQRPKLDTYTDQHMVVVYEALRSGEAGGVAVAQPAAADGTSPARAAGFGPAELHLFTGRNWLVSVQWAASPAVDLARSHFERHRDARTGELLYALLDAAADSYFPVLDAMAERMDALEDAVLEGDTDASGLREMLSIKRELLELRRLLGPMREVANSLLRRELPIVDAAALPYFQDLYDHLVRLIDQLDVYRDLLASILDARLTVTSNSLNTIMKRLTAITVLLMAPTLVAGIYGMNFEYMPELAWPFGYPMAVAIMAALMVATYMYFRRRNWF